MESTCNMSSPRPEESARPFPLHPCLVDPESEVAFLRCVARILLLCLLPQKDAKSHTLRCCLTEVITTKGPFYSSKYGGGRGGKTCLTLTASHEAPVAQHLTPDVIHLCLNLTSRTEGREMYFI